MTDSCGVCRLPISAEEAERDGLCGSDECHRIALHDDDGEGW